jgi:hypothetical protein
LCVSRSECSEAHWPGEVKISGRAIVAEPTTEGSDADLYYADIAEVVHTHLNEEVTMLVVEWWTPMHGLRRIEREQSATATSLPPASPKDRWESRRTGRPSLPSSSSARAWIQPRARAQANTFQVRNQVTPGITARSPTWRALHYCRSGPVPPVGLEPTLNGF